MIHFKNATQQHNRNFLVSCNNKTETQVLVTSLENLTVLIELPPLNGVTKWGMWHGHYNKVVANHCKTFYAVYTNIVLCVGGSKRFGILYFPYSTTVFPRI